MKRLLLPLSLLLADAALGQVPTPTPTITPVPISGGKVTLGWNASTTNTDGSPLVPDGYKIYEYPTSGGYKSVTPIDTKSNVTSWVIPENKTGVFWYVITAYKNGVESDPSNEVAGNILPTPTPTFTPTFTPTPTPTFTPTSTPTNTPTKTPTPTPTPTPNFKPMPPGQVKFILQQVVSLLERIINSM